LGMLALLRIAAQEVPAAPREDGRLTGSSARLHGDARLQGIREGREDVELPRIRLDPELLTHEEGRIFAPALDLRLRWRHSAVSVAVAVPTSATTVNRCRCFVFRFVTGLNAYQPSIVTTSPRDARQLSL